MTKISATVITLNEEDYIRGCLESLSWCDEIIVVDSYSDDDTVEIASEYTDKIFQKEEEGYSEPYRKFAAEKASGDWVVEIDADERISPGLRSRLEELKYEDFDAIKAPRMNFRFGKWMEKGGRWPDYTFCMYRTAEVDFSKEIHNYLRISDSSKIKTLEAEQEVSIIHYSYLGLSDHIERNNRYTDIEVDEKENIGASYARAVFEPIYSFFRSFLYKRGYRDGFEGLLASVMDGVGSLFYNLKLLEREKLGGRGAYLRKYRDLDEEMGFGGGRLDESEG